MKTLMTMIALFPLGVYAQMVGIAQGRVVGTDNQGLADVEMKFTSLDIDPVYEKTITTDDKGRFTLAGLKPSNYEVYCKKEGYNDQIYRFRQGIGKGEFDITMMTMEEAYEDAKEKGLIVEEPEDPKVLAKELYNQAVPLYKTENYAEALTLLDQSLESDPTLEHSIKLAAYCAINTAAWDKGMTYAKSYLELNPEDLNMAKLALKASEMTKNAEGVAKYTQLVKTIEGVTPASLYNEAVAALNANDDEAATAKLQELLKMDENYADAYYHLGVIKVREGEFEKAVELLKKFVKLDPKSQYAEEAKDLIVTLAE